MEKVLILGGNRYNKLAIESIKNAGIYVICMDRNNNAESKNYADEFYNIDFSKKEEVYKIARDKNVKAIIPTNDWGVVSAAYASQKLGLLFINEDVANIATNKYLMRKKWQEKGIDVPWFKTVSKIEEIKESDLCYPCIFKPQDSRVAGSRGVKVVFSKDEIEEAYKFAKQYSDEIIIEELLVGKEHSAEVLIQDNKYYILAISDKVKTPYPYRVDKSVIYPTSTKGEKLILLKNAIIKSIKALGIDVGAVHIEICATNDGRYIPFEVGARCGGGGTPNPIIKYVTGIDMMLEFTNILLGKKISFNMQNIRKYNNCIYHFLIPRKGKVKNINYNILENDPKVLDYEIFLSKGSEIKDIREGPDRAGFIIYKDREFNSENIIEVE